MYQLEAVEPSPSFISVQEDLVNHIVIPSTSKSGLFEERANEGVKTRKGIISHLYDELQKIRGIKTFKDDKRLEVGNPISPSLFRAIEESRFGIVVLSTNYASSGWCLEELTHIIRCIEDKNRVLPLFYEVDPSHVRKQTEGDAMESCFKKSGQSLRLGWDTGNFQSERELVKRIVAVVWGKILKPSADTEVLEIKRHVIHEIPVELEEQPF